MSNQLFRLVSSHWLVLHSKFFLALVASVFLLHWFTLVARASSLLRYLTATLPYSLLRFNLPELVRCRRLTLASSVSLLASSSALYSLYSFTFS